MFDKLFIMIIVAMKTAILEYINNILEYSKIKFVKLVENFISK